MILLDTHVVSEPLKAAGNTNVLAWIDAQIIETLSPKGTTKGWNFFGLSLLYRTILQHRSQWTAYT